MLQLFSCPKTSRKYNRKRGNKPDKLNNKPKVYNKESWREVGTYLVASCKYFYKGHQA